MKIEIKTASQEAFSSDVVEKTGEEEKRENIYQKISKGILYLVVFLLPLFFLPLTVNVLDFNKHVLLGVLVFVALVTWFIGMFTSGKVEFVLEKKLYLAILAFVGIYGISTVFSLWRYGSFWGWPLPPHQGFLSIITLVLFYFLAVNLFNKREEVSRVLGIFGVSLCAAGIFSLMQLFGVFIFPFDFARQPSFNTVGNVNALSTLLAVFLPIIVMRSFAEKRLPLKILFAIFSIFVLGFLVLVNFWVSWIALVVGMALVYIFGILGVKEVKKTSLVFVPLVLLVVSLFFLFFRFSLPIFLPLPAEVSPTFGGEIRIIKESFQEGGILRTIFGTGPGTFVYNYSKFKDPAVNQTPFWNARFSDGNSTILDMVLNLGILGLISFLGVLFILWKEGFFYLKGIKEKKLESEEWLLVLGVLGSLTAIFVSLLFYRATLSLMFAFWLVAFAISSLAVKLERKSFQTTDSSSHLLLMSTVLVVVVIVGFGLMLLGIQKYYAETQYLKALRLVNQNKIDEAMTHLTKAIQFNPGLDLYRRDLANVSLAKAIQLVSQQESVTSTLPFIRTAIDQSQRAVDLNPNDALNWQTRGFVYRQLIGLSGDAAKLAEASYKKALELEPANPQLYTELGLVYLADNKPDLAKNNFEKALSLRPNYEPALQQLEQLNRKEEKPQPSGASESASASEGSQETQTQENNETTE